MFITNDNKKGYLLKTKLSYFFISLFLFLTFSFSANQSHIFKKYFFEYHNNKILYKGVKNTDVLNNYYINDNGKYIIKFYDYNMSLLKTVNIDEPGIIQTDKKSSINQIYGSTIKKDNYIFSITLPKKIKPSYIKFFKKFENIDKNDNDFIEINLYNKDKEKLLFINQTKINLDKKYKRDFSSVNDAIILSHSKFIDNGPDKRRVDIVFIPMDYYENEMNSFHNTIHNILYNVCWGGWTDKRTFFDASPIKEFKKLFNFHYLDIINFPSDWDKQINCTGDDCKTWLDNYIKSYINTPPDIYVFITKSYPWSSLTSYWYIILRKDSCGNTLLRALARSVLGGRLYNEFDTEDNYSDGKALNEISDKNITIYTERDKIPWKHWISLTTPLPTPNTVYFKNTVGAFEGGNDYKYYYYRPQEKCVLHGDLWDFCKVCREHFTITLLKQWIHPFISASTNTPTSDTPINSADTPVLRFSVSLDTGLLTMFDSSEIVWFMDEKKMDIYDGKTSIEINTSDIKAGKHIIKAALVGQVRGTEGFIRKYIDTNFYYSFSEFELSKGEYKRDR
jgi:hypothetical protein